MGKNWISANWLQFLQSLGIIGGFFLTGYVAWKDEHARRVGNAIAIADQHRQIWREIYRHPRLARILEKNPDLKNQPISQEEELFVTTLILHLSTVARAMERKEFVKIEGLLNDAEQFFALPIPRAIWEKIKPMQDADFVAFLDGCLQQL